MKPCAVTIKISLFREEMSTARSTPQVEQLAAIFLKPAIEGYSTQRYHHGIGDIKPNGRKSKVLTSA